MLESIVELNKLLETRKDDEQKSKNDKKSKSTPDSGTKHSGVNGQSKIGKNEYEAEIFKQNGALLRVHVGVRPEGV